MSNQQQPERLLRVDQVATRLNCSRSWVYALCASGELAMVPIGRKKGYRVPRGSLEQYIARQIARFGSE
jgi:excisionase family DNA binding protein